MRVAGKTVVVTGAAGGIGAAMAHRFAAEGAAGVLVCDLDGTGAQGVAETIRRSGVAAVGLRTDVSDEAQVRDLVAVAEEQLGPIDLFCSNAGIALGLSLEEATDADWSRAWSIHVMAHVYAARAVLPSMLERGSGYLLNTSSAAGLLSAPGDVTYTVSKHAAVAFAEWLSITYGNAGIKVSTLCPQGVRTPLLMAGMDAPSGAARFVAAAGDLLEPEQVADAVIEGLAAERFLILPHPEVATFVGQKASDRDRWLAGMRRLLASHP